MTKSSKRQVLNLLETIGEMLKVLPSMKGKKKALNDCLEAVDSISNRLKQEEGYAVKTLELLRQLHKDLVLGISDINTITSDYVSKLKKLLSFTQSILEEEIIVKLSIAFLPYNASMWDSLASIYEAAIKDANCIAKVIPIPYYEIEQDLDKFTYEGDLFPSNIPIVHYSDYDIEIEKPDIIFIHNIYDQYNTITRVANNYFTSNLKEHTNMLVYVPYHLTSPIRFGEGAMRAAYNLPTVKDVDKIVLAGNFVEEEAIRAGVPKEKILTLGSPKIDSMLKSLNEDIEIPDDWKEVIEDKTVFLFNTDCLFFSKDIRSASVILDLVFDIPRYVDNTAVIWRPHPLTATSVKRYSPEWLAFLDNTYKTIRNKTPNLKNTILDGNTSYFPALKVADVLITGLSSILNSYLLTEKKVIFLGEQMPDNSLIPPEAFYYFFDKEEPWFELVKKLPKGYDPLAENRKGIASQIYECVDGTSGEKIYNAVKECVMRK